MKSAKLHRLKLIAGCILLTLSTVFSLVGCQFSSFTQAQDGSENKDDGTGENTQSPPPSENGGESTPSEEEPKKPLFYNRYTGLVCDEAISSCRPISICVGNFDEKTQKGLSFADILIETPVARDETRLWAITSNWGAISEITNIASAESYMFPLANAFDAVCAFSGGKDIPPSAPALNYSTGTSGNAFTNADGLLSSSGELLRTAALEKQFSLRDTGRALPYRLADVNSSVKPSGNTISSIHFAYSEKNTVDFAFDAESGKYLRSQCASPHKDAIDQNQLAFSNVILLFYNVSYYHALNGTTFTLDTTAGGSGFCYTGGGVVNITWSYDAGGSLVFKDENGEQLTLNRGKTYIGALRITDSTTLIAK